ncbi:MAG: hypothetical protein JST73_12565 [Actinobacteria bacterium]|nr:hypothetical protein [Actinomycetota bacterium]
MTVDALSDEVRAALGHVGALDAADPGRGARLRLANGQTATLLPVAASGYEINLDVPTGSGVVVIVADRISANKRRAYNERGWSWLDRRGHIRFHSGDVWIDADIPPAPRLPADFRVLEPFAGDTAIGVALMALRSYPNPLPGIRATAREVGVAASTAHEATHRLVDVGLLTRDLRAVVPGLFHALADQWHPPVAGLAERPTNPIAGTVLTGSAAAAALGAPVVIADDHPLALLTGDGRTVRNALRDWGTTPPTNAPATITLAPTPYAATPSETTHDGYPVADTIVVALDLAADRGRGREILDSWDVPDRVW